MRAVVVGAGFAGACAARMLRERFDCEVTVLEAGTAPGGMLRTLHTEEGLPYEYGPRVVSVFRGTEDILPYLAQFAELEERHVYQGTRLRPDYPVCPFPVDLESLRELPCGDAIEDELAEIRRAGSPPAEGISGNTWSRPSARRSPSWRSRASTGSSGAGGWTRCRRSGASSAGWSGSPTWGSSGCRAAPRTTTRSGGFNPIFERMLAGLDVRMETPVREVRGDGTRPVVVRSDDEELQADLVVATAPIDAARSTTGSGPLEWRGYRIEPEVVDGGGEKRAGQGPGRDPVRVALHALARDAGLPHDGLRRDPPRARAGRPAVILREVVDDSVSMYPVWWEADRFHRYLEEAARVERLCRSAGSGSTST